MLLHSYDYKEIEVVNSVKKDLKNHLETYFLLGKQLSAKAKILHLANDYGQLDVLLTLQEPQRKIHSYIADEEKRDVAKINYIVNKRKISYLENLEILPENNYDTLLISEENSENEIQKLIVLTSCVILMNCPSLKNTILKFGFDCILEENELIIFKKK